MAVEGPEVKAYLGWRIHQQRLEGDQAPGSWVLHGVTEHAQGVLPDETGCENWSLVVEDRVTLTLIIYAIGAMECFRATEGHLQVCVKMTDLAAVGWL